MGRLRDLMVAVVRKRKEWEDGKTGKGKENSGSDMQLQ